MKHFIECIKKYADFTGRARREEFWMFMLFYMIFSIAITFLEQLTGTSILGWLYSIGLLLPSLAVGARRLHDTGRTGWWQLLMLIPLIGLIVLIIFYCQDSHADNQYGSNPKVIS